ncbi:MAG TPA: protein phosphatase CheZ [Nevskia sp.]|nr:protein phosphatase CheZ [Nevskia sp.]
MNSPAPAPVEEAALYAGVARLTRSLHEGLRQLGLDARLGQVAGSDMPDAVLRLDHVVRMTEEAAHRTLDLVDEGRGVADSLADVRACLERLQERAGFVNPAELRGSCEAAGDAEARLRATLTALAQAQEYQDLSGQIIRRVIGLLRNAETTLLELLGGKLPPAPAATAQPELPGPAVPGMTAADQGDADRLLASLGF